MKNAINDEVILAARLFLATLFLIFGWRKLRDYSGTVSHDRFPPSLRISTICDSVKVIPPNNRWRGP